MKRIVALLVVLMGMQGVGMAAVQTWENVKKSGTIQMATEGAFRPFNFYEGKKLTGFEVELADAVAKKLGLKTEWKTQPFESLLIGLNGHRYELVIASHGITPERAKAVDFTDPHYCTGGVVVSKTGGPQTAADLKDKVVGVQVGSTYLEHMKKVSGVKELKTYPKDTDTLQNLMGGRIDAWVTDRFLAIEAAQKNKALQVGELLFTESVAMAVSKGDSELKGKVNDALKALLKDGTYASLSKKYFGQDIRCQ